MTADHGNADEMFELDKKTGAPKQDASGAPKVRTSHTLNPVPLHVFAPGMDVRMARVPDAGLANVAATLLQLLGFEAPEGYRPSLLE